MVPTIFQARAAEPPSTNVDFYPFPNCSSPGVGLPGRIAPNTCQSIKVLDVVVFESITARTSFASSFDCRLRTYSSDNCTSNRLESSYKPLVCGDISDVLAVQWVCTEKQAASDTISQRQDTSSSSAIATRDAPNKKQDASGSISKRQEPSSDLAVRDTQPFPDAKLTVYRSLTCASLGETTTTASDKCHSLQLLDLISIYSSPHVAASYESEADCRLVVYNSRNCEDNMMTGTYSEHSGCDQVHLAVAVKWTCIA